LHLDKSIERNKVGNDYREIIKNTPKSPKGDFLGSAKNKKMNRPENKELVTFLEKIPAIEKGIADGFHEKGFWWVKFQIDIENKYAWNVVQELGCIINYISLNERLPTVFYPVSPAPYLNGGPYDFLSWVIENKDAEFTSNDLKIWLEGRLPNPVDDLTQWNNE